MNIVENNKLDFTDQDIYVGLDVHKQSWTVCILTQEMEHKKYTQPPYPEILVKYLRRNFPGGRYHSVYEAGFCGFWIHEELTSLGVNSIVVHPADVPTSDKDKRNKNDKVDCRKLGKELRSGNLRRLYIPSREDIENRGMLRLRDDLVKKKTRIKNQIKSMLKIYGIETPEDIEERYWSNKYIAWIEGIKMEQASGEYTKKIRLEELKEIRMNVSKVTREIRILSGTEKYKNKVELLRTISGIGLITSMRIMLDIIEIERFRGFDKLNSYVGFIPNEDSSGEKERKGEMTKRCNGSLRAALIESSWIAVREDPALLMKFNKLCKSMTKNKAIIRIARMLLNRIRYVLKNMKPYIIGVVS